MNETKEKKEVEKNCKNCFNCRVRFTINLADILSTKITPQNRQSGILYIRCRKNYWDKTSMIPPLLFNIKSVEGLAVICPHFEGEDDEKDNSTL